MEKAIAVDTAPAETPPRYCTFCGVRESKFRFLIEGPKVFICDDCAELCFEIVQERRKRLAPAANQEE